MALKTDSKWRQIPSPTLYSSPSGASAYSVVDYIHCVARCYKEGHSHLCLALRPDTLIFLLGHGWSPQTNPYETSGESGLRGTFCDRQLSVQSLCSVRVEGNSNGPWEEAHRGSFLQGRRTNGLLHWRSYTIHNRFKTCFPTILYARLLHMGTYTFYKPSGGTFTRCYCSFQLFCW